MYSNSELDEYLKEFLGSRYTLFLEAQSEPRSIRVNKLRSTKAHFEKVLRHYKCIFKKIPYLPDGYTISNDPAPLSHTLAYFKGLFTYQGLSSQLPVRLLNVKPGQYVLDIAAAPGSKSTQLAAELQNKGILILNDYSTSRLQALNANMKRTGAVNFYILKLRGQNLGPLLPEYFDKVLCDAPCSALGTLHTNPEICGWWNLQKLHKLAQIQYYLLVSAVKMLKVGGEIVYSTCSIAPEENELVIDRLLKNYPMEIVSPLKKLSEQFDPGLTIYKNKKLNPALQSAIRIFPDHHQMEGFFMIKLRKTASISHAPSVNFSGWKQTFSADHPSVSKILGELSDSWGIPYNEWMKYRYYLTATRIWMISQEIDIILHDGFISAGLLLAERRITGWKLVHGSIQYFSKFIRNRTMTLDDASLIKLFKDGRLIQLDIPDGYYALTYKDEPIASVYAETGQLLIRLPHAFNLVL